MKKYKYSDLLIINDGNVFLAHTTNLQEVAYNDNAYSRLYQLEDGVMKHCTSDKLYEEDFNNIYSEYDEYCEKCGMKKFYFKDEYEDVCVWAKVEWDDLDHYLELETEHGINTDCYNVTDADIIEGDCFIADNGIEQDYPRIQTQRFFKFIADDGLEYYIKETTPFYIDQSDYIFEMIDKEEFESYD